MATSGNIPENITFVLHVDRTEEFGTHAFPVPTGHEKIMQTALIWATRYNIYVECDMPKTDPILEEYPNEFTDIKVYDMALRHQWTSAYKVIINGKYLVDLRDYVMLDIVKNGEIRKGYLIGKFVFAQRGSQMTLIRKGSEMYNEIIDYMKSKE